MAETVTKLPKQPNKVEIIFPIGDTIIDGAVIRPLTFQGFAEAVTAAQAMSQPKTFEARIKRVRMLRQIQYFVGTAQRTVSAEELMRMPIPAARTLSRLMESADEGKPGKIIRPGDGVDQAVTYELGTPIPVGQGKQPITELEFIAKTYGDVEDILAAPDTIQQTILLLQTIAKPLPSTLSALPSWASSIITMADGITISREILPLFTGSLAE